MIRVIHTGPTRREFRGGGTVPRLRVVTPGPSTAGMLFLTHESRRLPSSVAALPDAEARARPARPMPPPRPRRRLRSWSFAQWIRSFHVRLGESPVD
jgi:hypothetical protein